MRAHGSRVAITGIGVVSPYGVGREHFWQHVRRGCSATRAITDFDASPFPCMVAAPVPTVTIGAGARWPIAWTGAAVPIRAGTPGRP
jgi:3-oxoacyl-(acyl-carrier-protein) synthase